MSGTELERPSLGLAEWVRPFVVVALLVSAMWTEEVVDLLPHTNFDQWGIRPRQVVGLVGIPLAPFLHAGFGHLIGNTVPFLVLGCLIAASGLVRYLQVSALIAVVSGVGTQLVDPAHTDHIGASSVVFGYLTYLLARGFYQRNVGYLIVGVVVLFFYGGILWGVLPHEGISWQGHVFGAVGGVVAARVLHHQARPATATTSPD
ncbi:MAG: rhomboid family intramembrane serine protease [Acidimicrobiales bacterium]